MDDASKTHPTSKGKPLEKEKGKKKKKNLKYVLRLKQDMDRTLVTILIGNNIVNIVLSAIAALVANKLFGGWGVSIMIGVITFLIIIFGEITPKSHAINNSEKISRNRAFILYALSLVLFPIILIFLFLSRWIIALTGGVRRRRNLLISDDTIKSIATLGLEQGIIKKIERDIIHRVFIFGDRKIEEVMVPMPKVFTFKKDYDVPKASEKLAKGGFTRVPVVDAVKKKIVGIIYTKDLVEKNEGFIKPLMHKPVIVTKGTDITEVFRRMKKRRVHMAVVKDMKGKHIGIVTLEDILEELVGEIYDEYFEVKYGKAPPTEEDIARIKKMAEA
jgi:CBS domain containing-hemolysin-like protein